MINGFNSRCLHVITGEDYRVTATTPVYDLALAVRKRRMRYLGHVLRLPPDRIVRRSLIALVKGGTYYPEGSLFRSRWSTPEPWIMHLRYPRLWSTPTDNASVPLGSRYSPVHPGPWTGVTGEYRGLNRSATVMDWDDA